ncbi:MAG: alpha/beta hydrolase [Solirubrobacterales bacterium]|nr:alpha/beta hydrolase [Solirubrobacterales bacterium]HMT05958.1 alpha/beta hydrolase [Solirubrobacterales bacterium]
MGSRIGRPLKIIVGILLILLVLIALNAFALNNETESASLDIPGAQLVETTSGQLQVLDTGAPPRQESLSGFIDVANRHGRVPHLGITQARSSYIETPIVLIHGSAGAINWWDDLIPLLRTGHRVIAIDMLGYGGSAKPDSDYSVETQAGLVAQVLSRLDVSGAILVGHSLGGKVVTSVAEQSPGLVRGLVIIDSAPDNSFGGLSGGARAIRTPMLGQALWRVAPDAMIRRNVAQGFAPGYDVPDKYVDDVRAMTYPAYKESAARSEDFTESSSLPERLTEAGKPLLVIFGEEDQIYDARQALSAYAAIPGAETLLIAGSGHSPQIEAPEETAEAINAFAYRLAEKAGREASRRQRADRARAKARAAKARAARRARVRAEATKAAGRDESGNKSRSVKANASP